LAEFAVEDGVDRHGEEKTLPRMGGIERISRIEQENAFTAKDAKDAEIC
jgi:hypothetical protein